MKIKVVHKMKVFSKGNLEDTLTTSLKLKSFNTQHQLLIELRC